jgi:hypothetical protein
MFLLVVYFIRVFSKKKVCSSYLGYPVSLSNVLVYCGYVSTDEEKNFSRYLGKISNVYVKSNKVYLGLNFGSNIENVLIGYYGQKDLLSITKVNSINYQSDNFNNVVPIAEKFSLDDQAIKKMNEYLGKYVLWISFTQSDNLEEVIENITVNMTPQQKKDIVEQFDYVKKCSWYEERVKNYFLHNKNFVDFLILNLSKLSRCHLFGSNLYVYE